MKTKKTGVPVYVLCSRQSARQFIRLYAGVQPTPYWFHQTLTFGMPKPDIYLARSRLKTLLDRLEKTHPDMSCFWVREQEKDSGYHFHVIFVFFGNQPLEPEAMRKKFGAVVFAHWNDINGGGLFRNANLMTLRAKDKECIIYLTKWVKLSPKTSRSIHWNGQRRIGKHSMPAPKKEVKRLLKICFDDRNLPDKITPVVKKPEHERYDKRTLASERAYVENKDVQEWDDYKRAVTGSKKRVSDSDFIKFRNGEPLTLTDNGDWDTL